MNAGGGRVVASAGTVGDVRERMSERLILDAAKDLFYVRGFTAVGVNDLGAAVGVSGPAIYRHFSSKAEILTTLFDEAMDRLLELAGPPLDDPRENLLALARTHAEFALRDRALVSVYMREERSLSDAERTRLRRRQRAFVDRWVRALERCAPGRSPDEIEASAHALIGMLLSAAHWPGSVRGNVAYADLLVDLVDGAATRLAT